MALSSLYHSVLSLYQTLSAYLVNAKTLFFKNGIQLSLPGIGAHLVDAKPFLGLVSKTATQPLDISFQMVVVGLVFQQQERVKL